MYTLIVYSVFILIFVSQTSARVTPNKYDIERNELLADEENLSLGSGLYLTEEELQANRILMHWKNQEIDASFENHTAFNLSKHFFTYRKDIDKSKVYQIIKKMPKGGALHVHASMMLDADSLLSLTYEDHLYGCYSDDGLKLRFADNVPSQSWPCNWSLLSDIRNNSDDVRQFDAELRKHFTLYTEDENIYNADIYKTWDRFNQVYRNVKSLINYRPVREKAFYKSLENFYNDNVMYIEIRTGLSTLYELDGTQHDVMYLTELYKSVTDKFIEEHPDFVGVKLILTARRNLNIDDIQNSLSKARMLKKQMPDFFAGFDLVGQEDKGKTLTEFYQILADAKDDIDFFFHGGETNWFGTSADENLIDAILLGSKRIGHAYALLKHPILLSKAKQKDIALEVNVISNQVLSLVLDVRNHPLAVYFALGYPVVLSSDDPGVWEADPLSHDFYVAFVGVASKRSDLRLLKQLALNSIRYSALDGIGKNNLYTVFNEKWDYFIKSVISSELY